jgi:ketosteroid isomerase-like protein
MDETVTRTIVMRWFDALSSGDFRAAMACLDDNIRWINSPGFDGKVGGVPGLSAIVPWFGEFKNKAEVMATFGPYGEAQETVHYERLYEMFRGDQALIVAREVARIRATGLTYDIEFVQRYQVAHDKIILLRAYLDSSRMVHAFRGDMATRLLAAIGQHGATAESSLLAYGANPNTADPETADTALMIAAGRGDTETVRLLLAFGAEANIIGRKSGLSPLHAACRSGKAEVVRALIVAGAHVDLQAPKTGETPLIEALRHGNLDCADILLASGADAGISTRDGQKAADVAAMILGPGAPIRGRLAGS